MTGLAETLAITEDTRVPRRFAQCTLRFPPLRGTIDECTGNRQATKSTSLQRTLSFVRSERVDSHAGPADLGYDRPSNSSAADEAPTMATLTARRSGECHLSTQAASDGRRSSTVTRLDADEAGQVSKTRSQHGGPDRSDPGQEHSNGLRRCDKTARLSVTDETDWDHWNACHQSMDTRSPARSAFHGRYAVSPEVHCRELTGCACIENGIVDLANRLRSTRAMVLDGEGHRCLSAARRDDEDHDVTRPKVHRDGYAFRPGETSCYGLEDVAGETTSDGSEYLCQDR